MEALTEREGRAYVSVLEGERGGLDAREGALKMMEKTMARQGELNFDISDMFKSMAKGSRSTGDAVLLKTLGVMTTYVNSWLLVAFLAFAVYQLIRAGAELITKIWDWLKSIAGLFAGPINAVTGFVGQLIHPGTGMVTQGQAQQRFYKGLSEIQDADAGSSSRALAIIVSLVTAEVPIFGAVLASLPEVLSAVGAQDHMAGGRPLQIGQLSNDEDAYDAGASVAAAAENLGYDMDALQDEAERLLSGNLLNDEDNEDAYDLIEDLVGVANDAY
jgi:hypothetical protein